MGPLIPLGGCPQTTWTVERGVNQMISLLHKPYIVKLYTKGKEGVQKMIITWFMDAPLMVFDPKNPEYYRTGLASKCHHCSHRLFVHE